MTEDQGELFAAGLRARCFSKLRQEIYARVFRELKPRTALPALAGGFLPLRQCRQFHPAGERAAARPYFGPVCRARRRR